MSEVLGTPDWKTRTVNMSQLGRALGDALDPPIKALFVYNCNPVVTVPDQNAVIRGLLRDDLFTVVFDQVRTDSAAYADILLPATTFLEHDDVCVSYGTYVVGGVRPVIPARGEARSNPDVFAALGRGMGWDDEPFHWDPQHYVRKVANSLTLGETRGDGGLLEQGRGQSCEYPSGTPIQFQTVRPLTRDGKIEMTPAELGREPYRFDQVRSDDYPLALISPATARLVSSTLGEFNYDELVVTVHPVDASAREIDDGDEVRVFNDLGAVICRAAVRSSVRPGVVSMPKGAWRRSSRNGATSTALCPADVNVVAGGACFNDARVDISRSA
jgi:anaerobic selenocysteine-containing dehydrogenase